MRVAFVAWRDLAHAQAGGSELVVDRLASGLAERGHDVALMCGGPVGPRPYPVVDLGGTYAQYFRAPFAHARHFRNWDLLVDVENGVPYFSPWWRRRASLCLVHHVHTDQWPMRFPQPVAGLGRFLEGRVMPRAYRGRIFVAASLSTATALTDGLGVPPEMVRMIRWGVDEPASPVPPEADEPRFVVLGRLVPHKRVDLILRAWEQVRPQTGGVLAIVGDGPDRARLEQLAPPGVVFTGRVDEREKTRMLGRAWALIHAAHHEGWGMVVTEAAAAGRPTVAMNAQGIRDAVVDGVTGILAQDDSALVASWLELARRPELRRRLGEAARLRARASTWTTTLDAFEQIAVEAVGRPTPMLRAAA